MTTDKVAEFEKYPELAKHLTRMAYTGNTGNISEWSEFIGSIDRAITQHTQSIIKELLEKLENCNFVAEAEKRDEFGGPGKETAKIILNDFENIIKKLNN